MKREHRTVFAPVVVWFLIAVFALFDGLVSGNEMNFVLGDWYKFARYSLMFLIVYFSINSIRQVYSFYVFLVILWIVFVLGEISQFYSQILSGVRLTSYAVLAGGAVLPIVLCLRRLNVDRSVRPLTGFAIGIALATPILAQSKGSLLNILIAFGLVWYLSYRFGIGPRRRPASYTPLVYSTVLLSLVLAGFLLRDHFLAPLSGFGQRLSFTVYHSNTYMAKGVAAGGVRLPEALSIWKQFSETPWRLLTGFGLGSSYEVWGARRHFVHIGLVEVLFRTGVFGLLVFLWIPMSWSGYALRRVKRNRHFLLPALVGILFFGGLVFLGGNPFTVAPIYSMPVLAGMLKVDLTPTRI